MINKDTPIHEVILASLAYVAIENGGEFEVDIDKLPGKEVTLEVDISQTSINFKIKKDGK